MSASWSQLDEVSQYTVVSPQERTVSEYEVLVSVVFTLPWRSGRYELLRFPIRGFVFVLELSDGRLKLSHECFKLGKVRLYRSRTRRFLGRRTKGLARETSR